MVQMCLLPSAVDLMRQNMRVLVCTCFGCACICVHALYICMYVYLVYMLAICSLLVIQMQYNSLVYSICIPQVQPPLCTTAPLTLLREQLVGVMYTYIRMYIYYTIHLYCISNCNFVFASCSQSCLHLPLPHLDLFQVPKHLLTHYK